MSDIKKSKIAVLSRSQQSLMQELLHRHQTELNLVSKMILEELGFGEAIKAGNMYSAIYSRDFSSVEFIEGFSQATAPLMVVPDSSKKVN